MVSTEDLLEIGNSKAVPLIAFALLSLVPLFIFGSIPTGEDGFKAVMFGVLFFLGGLLGIAAGFGTFRDLQLVRNTPTSKIRSMAMGLVEVKGESIPSDRTVKAPISDEDCLFYVYKVEEYQQQGKHKNWVTIDSGRDGEPFHLDDGTGTVTVDPEGAELEIPWDRNIHLDGGEKPPDYISEFIESNPKIREGSNEAFDIFDNDRRFKEKYVLSGEQVYVFGKAMNRRSEYGEYTVINKDRSTPMFVISDRSEKELREDWGWSYKLYLGGGAVVAIASYGFLVLLMGLL